MARPAVLQTNEPPGPTRRHPVAPEAHSLPAREAVLVPGPLVPVALAATAGVLLDRYVEVSVVTLAIAFAFVVACSVVLLRRPRALLHCLLLATGLLAATWHRLSHQEPANSIGHCAAEAGTPVRLRGLLLTRVILETAEENEALRSRPGLKRTSATLEAQELWQGDVWRPVSGRVRLSAGGELEGIFPGDLIECQGELLTLQPPANPGEFDVRRQARDRGVYAFLHVKTVEAISLHQSGRSLQRILAEVRRSGGEVLQHRLSRRSADVAEALLLGDDRLLAGGKLEGYVRTGVFHVLAISGQHLVILCGGLWIVTRLLGVPRRRAAWILALFVIGYALLTGAGAAVVRAAVLVCTACGGILLRRQANPLNSLALAWLVIILFNPADIFETGCQLSFLAVLALIAIIRPLRLWARPEIDPLEQLTESLRPHWQTLLVGAGRWLVWALITSLVVWLVCAPLLAARMHLVSPVAVLLSPFMVVLTAIALLLGFPLLLLGPLIGPAAAPFAWIVENSLKACDILVRWGESVPAGYWFSAGLPDWWLIGFYVLAVGGMLVPAGRKHWKPMTAIGVAWLLLGLFLAFDRPGRSGLRCTFLAVGHGGCVVLETPDGRTLLYDAGSLAGPEVTQRHIAPFLWSRGVTRIDEVFVSHADLDHFNGLPALLDRFSVAQISLTPSFLNRPEPGVRSVKDRLEKGEIPIRILSAGDLLRAGEVRIDVLHPPRQGPPGNENARSLVLLVHYAGRRVLLTGDLEGLGLPAVTAGPSPRPDVLLAPHHGSATSNTDAFARWATDWATDRTTDRATDRAVAGLVVSSEARPRWRRADPYTARGATVWRTGIEGAVIVHIDEQGVRAEAYRSGKQWRR